MDPEILSIPDCASGSDARCFEGVMQDDESKTHCFSDVNVNDLELVTEPMAELLDDSFDMQSATDSVYPLECVRLPDGAVDEKLYTKPVVLLYRLHSLSGSVNGNNLQTAKCSVTMRADKRRQLQVQGSDQKRTCVVCGKKIAYAYNMKVHLRAHSGEKPFECKHCGKRFAESGNRSRHMRIHANERTYRYRCAQCSKTFYFKCELIKHSIIHTREQSGYQPFKCELCGSECLTSGGMKVHMRKHTGVKPYHCETCGKDFGDPSVFLKHKQMHSGIKPHKCTLCGRTFVHKMYLQNHMLTHSGDKRHYCRMGCDKVFAREWDARQHEKRIHAGLRQYKCPDCGRDFSYRNSLVYHMNIHRGEKPYHCPLCDYRTAHRSNLPTHMHTHDGSSRRFGCGICAHAYASRRNCRRHFYKVHRNNDQTH